MKLKVLENRRVSRRDYLLKVEAPEALIKKIKPGQFAMVQVRDEKQLDPLLRRPFGIFDTGNDTISFLYRVYGRGTSLLTKIRDSVDVLFPLGNYIDNRDDKYLFIAGGIGIAGLFLAARKFKEEGKVVKVIYGEKTSGDFAATTFLKKFGIDHLLVTEDGSEGERGVVTEYISNYKDYTWVACGPVPMLKEVKAISETKGIKCFLSLDSRMACGVGACLGCVVRTKSGFKRVCVEGPIFNSKDVVL